MTVGYPDFQAYANATAAPIADQDAFSLVSGSPFTAAGYLSNYPSSRIRVVPSGTTIGATCLVQFYLDASLAVTLGSYSWTVAASGGLAVIVPNLGPYVVLTVSTTSAVANNTAIQLTPLVAACASPRYIAVGNSAEVLGNVIPASGSATITMPFVAEGPGYWYVNPRDTAGQLTATVWELSENGSRILKVDSVAAGFTTAQSRLIYGSARLLQVQVTNTDAANTHTWDGRIAIDGR